MTVRAMKGGTKPFRDRTSLRLSRPGSQAALPHAQLPRGEIMIQAAAGRLNKQIANDIGITESIP
jgi:hypothetical protein